MKKPSRGLIGYIVLIAAFILMAVLLSGGKSTGGEITYPDLLKKVQDGKVEYVAVRGQNLYYDSVRSYAEFPDSYDFYCVIGSDFLDTLRTMAAADAGVDRAMISEGNLVFSGKSLDIIYLAPLTTPWILEWLPFILMIAVLLVVPDASADGRQRQGDELWPQSRSNERSEQKQDSLCGRCRRC